MNKVTFFCLLVKIKAWQFWIFCNSFYILFQNIESFLVTFRPNLRFYYQIGQETFRTLILPYRISIRAQKLSETHVCELWPYIPRTGYTDIIKWSAFQGPKTVDVIYIFELVKLKQIVNVFHPLNKQVINLGQKFTRVCCIFVRSFLTV